MYIYCVIIKSLRKEEPIMKETLDFGFTEKELDEIEEISVNLSLHACEGGSEGWAG